MAREAGASATIDVTRLEKCLRVAVCVQTKGQVLHQPVTLLAGITVGNFAFWADSLLVAVLLHYGANSFNRVTEAKRSNQLPYIFQARLSDDGLGTEKPPCFSCRTQLSWQ